MKSLITYINEAKGGKTLNPSTFINSSAIYTMEEDPENTGNGICKLFVNPDDLIKRPEVLDIAINIDELSSQYKKIYKTKLNHIIIDYKNSLNLLFYSGEGKTIKDITFEAVSRATDFIITTGQKYSNCIFLGKQSEVLLFDENVDNLVKKMPTSFIDETYGRYKWFTPQNPTEVSKIFKNCSLQGIGTLYIGKKGDRKFNDFYDIFNNGGLDLETRSSEQHYRIAISNYFTYIEKDGVYGMVGKNR